ncbi:MAG: hypothetical protein ACXABY_11515 [Candidatus Thorarchaeota archaeon]|jgi:hypothetical protein
MPKIKKKLETLPKKYPQLFKSSCYGDVDGEPFFYFQCSDGWYDLLDTFFGNIRQKFSRWKDVKAIQDNPNGETMPWVGEYFERNPLDPLDFFIILQIKEKFGGLRIYWGGAVSDEHRNYIRGAVDIIEALSHKVCETCGAPGETRRGSWIVTLCDPCEEELRASQKATIDGKHITD